MAQKNDPKEELKRREDAQAEHLKFIRDAYHAFWRWQLDQDVIAYPFLMGPWANGNSGISAEIGFRPMTEDDRTLIKNELARQAGIEIPKSGIDIVT